MPENKRSTLEVRFDKLLARHGIAGYVTEYTFCPGRRWRMDYAWLDQRVAVEIQGGIYIGGRHGRGAALENEYEKLNTAVLGGWRVLLITGKMMRRNKQTGRIAALDCLTKLIGDQNGTN